jgi:hypothetical protein
MDAKFNSNAHFKRCFSDFGFKDCKNCKCDLKIEFYFFCILRVSKNSECNADFKVVEKVGKNL